MKNKEIENVLRGLTSTYKKRLPVKLSYAIAKNKSKLYSELNDIVEQRTKIMESYCIKDEHGNPLVEDNQYKFENDEAKGTAINEYEEFLELESEVKLIKVPFEVVEKCDESGKYDALTAEELNALDFMLGE